jgi:hydrogenase maturation protease
MPSATLFYLWLNRIMRIKLLGLGHYLRGDDEIGLELVRRWKVKHEAEYPETLIEVEILESPGVNLLGALAGLDAAVLVDAVQSGAPPGTVLKFGEEDLVVFGKGSGSVHGWGAAETLALGRRLVPEILPPVIILIGVEAVAFELGEGLSPAVRASIPKALGMINRVLKKLTKP